MFSLRPILPRVLKTLQIYSRRALELFYYFDMGVDGIFAENMLETREIRMKYQYEKIGVPPPK